MPAWPEIQIPDFRHAFPGLQSLMLWMSCIVLGAAALSTRNYLSIGRPFVFRSLGTALAAYFVAAPGLFTLRAFVPTFTAIFVHVFAFTAAVAILWVVLFQPGRGHAATSPNRFLW